MNNEVKKFFEDHPEATILGDGELVHIEKFPSLGEILRQSKPWEKVYKAMKEYPDMQEILVTVVKDKMNTVATETVHKLAIAGMNYQEIADDTGLSTNYVIETLGALGSEWERQKEDGHG